MEDVKAVLEKGIERWNAHDREGFLRFFDEKIVFVDMPTGHELVGREEFGRGFFDLWLEAYPDVELKDVILFAEAKLVCFQALFVGTHTGVLHAVDLEMPPTGKHIESPFVFIAEVEDGLVKKARIFYDRLRTLEQEGILEIEKLAGLASV